MLVRSRVIMLQLKHVLNSRPPRNAQDHKNMELYSNTFVRTSNAGYKNVEQLLGRMLTFFNVQHTFIDFDHYKRIKHVCTLFPSSIFA